MLSLLPSYVAAYVYVLIGLLAATFCVHRTQFGGPDAMRWSILWLIITTVAFLGQHIFVFIIAVWIVCAKLVPSESNNRIVFYTAILCVIPMFEYRIPGVAGINYFFSVNYPRLLTMFLLIPLLFVKTNKRGAAKHQPVRSKVDLFVVLYTVWTCVLALGAESITDAIRKMLETIAFMTLPYFAVSRSLRSLDDMRRVIVAMVFSGIMVSFVGLLEQYTDWWFYRYVPEVLRLDPMNWLGGISYARDGMIRVKSSIDGGLAYFMVILLGCLLFLSQFGVKRIILYALGALFTIILYFTGSRGALLAAVVLVALHFGFKRINSPVKTLMLIVGAIIAFQFVDVILSFYQDEYGTFDYRRDLIKAAVPLIKEHFVWGFHSFRELEATGRLEHLRQGEGIIDIVNTYLLVGLFQGGVALVLFVAIFLVALFELVALPAPQDEDAPLRYGLRRLIVIVLLSTMFLITTVSPVAYLPVYYWMFFALAAGYSRLVKQAALEKSKLGKRATVPSAAGEAVPSAGHLAGRFPGAMKRNRK